MITDKKTTDTLMLLITSAGVMRESDLEEALQDSKRLDISLERAIVMAGKASDNTLKLPLEALKLVNTNQAPLDDVVAALRLVSHQHMSLSEAMAIVRVHAAEKHPPKPVVNVTSEIGQLLLAAGVITQDQLEQATQKGQQSAIPVGRMLRLNRDITSMMLNSAINAQLLLRDKKATREQVIAALKFANKKKASIEQALFELGNYQQPGDNELKLSDLFSMAGLITDSDRLECLELEIIRKQPIGQILQDQGLATQELVETAIHLQGTVASETVRAYQAAEALRRVGKDKVSVYQALAELRYGAPAPPMRLGDLLVATEFATTQQIESALEHSTASNIKVGKVLLHAGIISEDKLFSSLRCQSLVKFGFLSDAQAIAALRQSDRNKISLDDAFSAMGLYAPTSMQWSWV